MATLTYNPLWKKSPKIIQEEVRNQNPKHYWPLTAGKDEAANQNEVSFMQTTIPSTH